MNRPVVEQQQQGTILYDPLWRGKISTDWFQPRYWDRNITPVAEGRGSSYFVDYDDQPLVLRHYRRGGLIARWLGDQYFWSGLERSRPWREWKLLALMHSVSLPVPRPVAARVEQQGWFYRGDILIERILDSVPLSRWLQQEALPLSQWQEIGRCISRFHRQGIYHADLNAHNILLRQQEVFLIDFDKAEQRPPGRWQQANLQRLLRSLSKLANLYPCFAFNEQDWQQLLSAYHEEA